MTDASEAPVALEIQEALEPFVSPYVKKHILGSPAMLEELKTSLANGEAFCKEEFMVVAMIDISGYSKLTSDLSTLGKLASEVITESVGAYLEKVINVVASFEGNVVKFLGDALLLCFHPEFDVALSTEELPERTAMRALQCLVTVMTHHPAAVISMNPFNSPTTSAHPDTTRELRLHSALWCGRASHVVAGVLGKRLDYFVVGGFVDGLAQALDVAKKDEIGLSASVVEVLRDSQAWPARAAAAAASGIVTIKSAEFTFFNQFLSTRRGPAASSRNLADLGRSTGSRLSFHSMVDLGTGSEHLETFIPFYVVHKIKTLMPQRGGSLAPAPVRHFVLRASDLGDFRTVTIVFVKLMAPFSVARIQRSLVAFLNSVDRFSGVFQQLSVDDKGDPVCVAARLMAITPTPNVATLDLSVKPFLQNKFITTPLGLIKVKGKPEPMELFEISLASPKQMMRAKSACPSELQVRMSDLQGYENEKRDIGAAIRAWAEAWYGGGAGDARCLVTITGQSGSGKSMLLEFAIQTAKECGVEISVTCGSELRQVTALWGIQDIITIIYDRYTFEQPEDSPATPVSFLAHYGLAPELARTLNILISGDSDDSNINKDAVEQIVMTVLPAYSSSKRVCFAFDDAQWIDRVSLEILGKVLGKAQKLPGEEKLGKILSMEGGFHFILKGLLQADVEKLFIQKLQPLGVKAISSNLLKGKNRFDTGNKKKPDHFSYPELFARCEGMPLNASLMAEAILDAKNIFRIADGVLADTVSAEAFDSIFSGSVGAIIISQFDRLNPAYQQLLRTASVLGQYVGLQDLSRIVQDDETDTHSIVSTISSYDDFNFLTKSTSSKSSDYIFRHISIRNTIYESLPRLLIVQRLFESAVDTISEAYKYILSNPESVNSSTSMKSFRLRDNASQPILGRFLSMHALCIFSISGDAEDTRRKAVLALEAVGRPWPPAKKAMNKALAAGFMQYKLFQKTKGGSQSHLLPASHPLRKHSDVLFQAYEALTVAFLFSLTNTVSKEEKLFLMMENLNTAIANADTDRLRWLKNCFWAAIAFFYIHPKLSDVYMRAGGQDGEHVDMSKVIPGCYMELGFACFARGEYTKALEAFLEDVNYCRQNNIPNDLSMDLSAGLFAYQGNFEKCLSHIEENTSSLLGFNASLFPMFFSSWGAGNLEKILSCLEKFDSVASSPSVTDQGFTIGNMAANVLSQMIHLTHQSLIPSPPKSPIGSQMVDVLEKVAAICAPLENAFGYLVVAGFLTSLAIWTFLTLAYCHPRATILTASTFDAQRAQKSLLSLSKSYLKISGNGKEAIGLSTSVLFAAAANFLRSPAAAAGPAVVRALTKHLALLEKGPRGRSLAGELSLKKDEKKEEKGKDSETKPQQPKKSALEEDDEFEDFPADEGWDDFAAEEKLHAWEDTWEDYDESEDFAKVLAAEHKKRNGVAPMKMPVMRKADDACMVLSKVDSPPDTTIRSDQKKPQQFVSSRSSRATVTQKAEDFMDEEDFKEREYEKKIEAQEEFDILGGTQKELQRKQALTSAVAKETESRALGVIASSLVEDFLLGPPKDSVGVKLIRLMGWREGQGVGPRRKRTHSESIAVEGEVTFAPKVETYATDLRPKTNDCGLGFDPFKNAKDIQKAREEVAKGGFGTGVLDEEEEEDIYDMGSKGDYNIVLEEEGDSLQKDLGRSEEHEIPRESKPKPTKIVRGGKIGLDGRPALVGFIISNAKAEPFPWFEAPKPPPGYTPGRLFDLSKKDDKVESGLTNIFVSADKRREMLGEEALKGPSRSVFSYVSVKDQERLQQFIGKATEAANPDAPRQTSRAGESVDKNVAEAALKGFMPFTTDPAKQDHRLLCKRFNVPNPYPPEKGKGKPPPTKPIENDKEILNEKAMDKLRTLAEGLVTDKEARGQPETKELRPNVEDIYADEPARPSMDVFKEIFADDDDDSGDEETEKTTSLPQFSVKKLVLVNDSSTTDLKQSTTPEEKILPPPTFRPIFAKKEQRQKPSDKTSDPAVATGVEAADRKASSSQLQSKVKPVGTFMDEDADDNDSWQEVSFVKRKKKDAKDKKRKKHKPDRSPQNETSTDAMDVLEKEGPQPLVDNGFQAEMSMERENVTKEIAESSVKAKRRPTAADFL
ncbi:hypothetical protein HDU96_000781 [Phlyctochytrium bullatum]|nr:hypothetical protein HDU96_000781 [Phlyctochytrium bullatum]